MWSDSGSMVLAESASFVNDANGYDHDIKPSLPFLFENFVLGSTWLTYQQSTSSTFIATAAAVITGTIGVQVVNKGAMYVQTNAALARILCDFQNFGPIAVQQQGTLAVASGINWNSITVQSGSVLRIESPTYLSSPFYFDRSSSVVVSGQLNVAGGTLIMQGTYDAASSGSTVVTSGILDIRSEATIVDLGAPFSAEGGTANFNCRALSLSSMQMGRSDGTAAGIVVADGDITVLGNLNFFGGALQGRGTTLVQGDTSFTTDMTKSIQSHSINMLGSSASWAAGNIALSSDASLVVGSGVILSITTPAAMTDSTGDSQVINYGTIRQASSSAIYGATLYPSVINYGTGTVQPHDRHHYHYHHRLFIVNYENSRRRLLLVS